MANETDQVSANSESLEVYPDSEVEGADEGDLEAQISQDPNLEKADRSLSELKRWFDDGDLIIDPEWQRNYVWNNKQASKLIESFLLNIPIPVVYFARTSDERYEVIDGYQRLNSIFMFLDNKLKLNGLDFHTEHNGRYYKDIESHVQRKIRNSTLRSFELGSSSSSDLHFIVFERLNTGGTKLNEMEIRNCIFRGTLNDLIKELSENKDFITCVNQKTLSKRMDDRNLVLRFLAFYERTHYKYNGGLKKFLNEFFETYRNPPDGKLEEYKSIFEKCMKASLTVFGDRGFRLKALNLKGSQQIGEWSTRINMPIFQCISTSFAGYKIEQITRSADRIYEEYIDMISTDDGRWVDYVRRATTEPTRLRYVFNTWADRLEKVMKESPPNDGRRVFSRNLKLEMFSQSNRCSICNQEIKLLDDAALDHIRHYWRGGATIPENARLAHRHCNSTRGVVEMS